MTDTRPLKQAILSMFRGMRLSNAISREKQLSKEWTTTSGKPINHIIERLLDKK